MASVVGCGDYILVYSMQKLFIYNNIERDLVNNKCLVNKDIVSIVHGYTFSVEILHLASHGF